MAAEDLHAEVDRLKESLFRLNFKLALGEVDTIKKMRQERKSLARLKTEMRQREMQAGKLEGAHSAGVLPIEARRRRAYRKGSTPGACALSKTKCLEERKRKSRQTRRRRLKPARALRLKNPDRRLKRVSRSRGGGARVAAGCGSVPGAGGDCDVC